MKVVPESIINNNRNIAKKTNPDDSPARAETAARPSERDKIIITSNQGTDNTGISDAQFISRLKRSILSEVQTDAPEYMLDSLKQRIALNEYDINVPDIIRKMLLDNYEVNYE